MREIGFRGKSILLKEFVYGFILQYEAGAFITDGMILSQIDPETAGQFTGFTDKNGKPIFDGDIVGCFGNTQIFEIKWCSVRGGYFLDNIRMSGLGECRPECLGNLTDTLEVIGNVFDNPELLEWVE